MDAPTDDGFPNEFVGGGPCAWPKLVLAGGEVPTLPGNGGGFPEVVADAPCGLAPKLDVAPGAGLALLAPPAKLVGGPKVDDPPVTPVEGGGCLGFPNEFAPPGPKLPFPGVLGDPKLELGDWGDPKLVFAAPDDDAKGENASLGGPCGLPGR